VNSRVLLPTFPATLSTNQQVLYALAAGTGGFTIANTNDLLGGLDRIGQELSEYYLIRYVPPAEDREGACHTIKLKVEEKDARVRARNGYCDVKTPDFLAGKIEGKNLEARAASGQPGNVAVALQPSYFYTAADRARVNLAMQIPGASLKFEKGKNGYHSELNVLGIAYRPDGSVAARFSDTVKLDLEKDKMKELETHPYNYTNAFDIAPGKYKLAVILSTGGADFGKQETPLVVEPFDGKEFTLSALTLSNEMRPIALGETDLDAALLEERKPLLVGKMELIPSATNRFKPKETVGLYCEVYEPLRTSDKPPQTAITYMITERKTHKLVFQSGVIMTDPFARAGSPVIPVAVKLLVDKLEPGDYTVNVQARDTAGHLSEVQSSNFILQ
jgi:hypothetical protein